MHRFVRSMFLLLPLLLCVGGPARADEVSRDVRAGDEISGDLEPGDLHTFVIDLPAGEHPIDAFACNTGGAAYLQLMVARGAHTRPGDTDEY